MTGCFKRGLLVEDERLASFDRETEREWEEATTYVRQNTNLSQTKAHVAESDLTHERERDKAALIEDESF
jgi:hypothetical protein